MKKYFHKYIYFADALPHNNTYQNTSNFEEGEDMSTFTYIED